MRARQSTPSPRMKIVQTIFWILAGSIGGVAPASGAAPLIQASDLSYLGSFKLPVGNNGGVNGGFDYGGHGLTYNPANNSLFLSGHVYDSYTAEVSIPAVGGTATILQPFKDAFEGKLGQIGIGTLRVGGHLVYSNKLYMTGFIFYDGDGSQTRSHFSRPLNLSVAGQVSGPAQAGSMGAGFYSGYMASVPTEWQTALGGPAVTGNCCLSIISRTSYGPALFSFNPENLGIANPLVYYTQSNQTLGTYGAPGAHPVFNGTTRITGVVIPQGSASVLFTGQTGIGDYCYGEAADCGDPSSSSKGEHAYPYRAYVWAYDVNDLAAVKAGTKQPWEVTPYATWPLSEVGSVANEFSMSAAYDPSTKKVYLSEYCGDANCMPLIHVYQIDIGTTPPTPPPPGSGVAPTASITSPAAGASFPAGSSVTIQAAAADGDGSVVKVEFFVDGVKLGQDLSAPYALAWNDLPQGPHSLVAVATDDSGATGTSVAVSITVSGVLPSPWQSRDIGPVAIPGGVSYSSGAFTVAASGADIWDTSDAFHFVYQSLSGDGQIVARVSSIQNTDPWAKAGVMIREALSPDSRHAMVIVSPSNGSHFQRRTSPGAASASTPGAPTGAPYWMKLVRSGATFSAFVSADGALWSAAGTDTIAMGTDVFAGLAVTSHADAALTSAVLQGVTLVAVSSAAPPAPPPPPPPPAETPSCAPLPSPVGAVIEVSSEAELQSAVANLQTGDTIRIAPGNYNLSGTLYIPGGVSNITIRGATGNRDDVSLIGSGMSDPSVPFGFWLGNAQNISFADFTLRDINQHAFIFNTGAETPRIQNVRMLDVGDQFIKANPDGAGGGVDGGVVECSAMEYATNAPDSYTNGVDVHTGKGWLIRNNLFTNIRGPAGQPAGPAILMWNGSQDTITEGNLFKNCERGIAYGLGSPASSGHLGGIIRNNIFFRAASQSGDVGISLENSAGTKVLNNTVVLSGTYSNAIEYRFPGTQNSEVANNLTDAVIESRDGAGAAVSNNLTMLQSSWFVDLAMGNLHLTASASPAIDQASSHPDVTKDFDGQARPAGGGPDIGADEFGGGVPTPPPPARPRGLHLR